MIAEHLATFVATAEPLAIRQLAGLSWTSVDDATTEQTMDAPPGICEEDGTPMVGALVLLADSTVGTACATDLQEGCLTLSLRVDLARRARSGRITARGRRLTRDRNHAIGVGELVDVDGVFGQVSLHSLTGFMGSTEPAPRLHHAGAASTPASVSVDGAFEVEVEDRGEGWVRVSVPARGELASGHRKLHGGAIAIIADRGLSHVLDRSPRHPVTFEIEYLRPVPCAGDPIAVEARVLSSSRRFVRASAEVLLPDGRVAATVRVLVERG